LRPGFLRILRQRSETAGQLALLRDYARRICLVGLGSRILAYGVWPQVGELRREALMAAFDGARPARGEARLRRLVARLAEVTNAGHVPAHGDAAQRGQWEKLLALVQRWGLNQDPEARLFFTGYRQSLEE